MDGFEEISIEAVCIGDVVCETPMRPNDARCVVEKRAKSNARTERIVGWVIVLAGGELMWLPHDAILWRRRSG